MVKKKRKKRSNRVTVAVVAREMDKPRVAKSARREDRAFRREAHLLAQDGGREGELANVAENVGSS